MAEAGREQRRPSGWIGIYLDGHPDWADVAERLQHAHELAAPSRYRRAQRRETKG